jgi:hypothetical protein
MSKEYLLFAVAKGIGYFTYQIIFQGIFITKKYKLKIFQ